MLIRSAHVRRFASLVTAALAGTTAGCGDSTDPGNHVDVTVGVGWIVGPNFNQAPQAGNRVECEVRLYAVATGSGRATWGAATFKWYAGKDRATPFDSSVAPAPEVRRGWGDSSIVAGIRQGATWTVWASVPFSGAIDFRYGDARGREQTASVTFDCGPSIPAEASPPSITNIAARSERADIEPGGLLTVDYTVTSSIGVWRTAVLVSGPCEVYEERDERLEKTLDRTVTLSIPANCELGAPIDVTVFATDAVLDRRVRQISTPYTLVDKTRPWLRGTTLPRPTGPYFTGDTIDFVVETGDNHVVRSIVWEARPFGARDSIVSPPRGENVKIRIPVEPDWSGPMELRYFARDAAGLVSDTVASSQGTVAVYPTVERPTTWMATEVFNEASDGEIVDHARGVVYLRQPGPRRITVMSLASMKVISTIPLAPYPEDFDLTVGGDSLLVALPELGALGVIDLTRTERRLELLTLEPIPGYPPSMIPMVTEVRALSNRKAFLAVNIDPGTRRLLEIDLVTGAQRFRFDAGSSSAIGGVEGDLLTRSHDGSAMVVRSAGCIQRYDAGTDQFAPCIAVASLGAVSSADASGQRFSVGTDIYDASWRRLQRIEMLPAGSGGPSALTLDGRELFVPYRGGLVRSSAVDGRILDRQLPPVTPNRLHVSPDGRLLIVVGFATATGYPAIGVVAIR